LTGTSLNFPSRGRTAVCKEDHKRRSFCRLLRNVTEPVGPDKVPEIPSHPSHFSILINIAATCLFVWRTRKSHFPSVFVLHGPIIKSVFIHNLTGQGHIGPLAKKRKGCHFFGPHSRQCHPSFPKCVNILIDQGLPGPPVPAFSGPALYLNLRGRPKTSHYASGYFSPLQVAVEKCCVHQCVILV